MELFFRFTGFISCIHLGEKVFEIGMPFLKKIKKNINKIKTLEGD